jgi:hypothetical protein
MSVWWRRIGATLAVRSGSAGLLSAGASVATAALVGLVAILGPVSPALAAAACDNEPERANVRPVAPAALAADLPEPFHYVGIPAPQREAILRDVVDVVQRQATEVGADACFREKPRRIAERVDFLSPYELLVESTFAQEPARRDALLDQYLTDPRGAIRSLGEAFPSTRAQATLASYAYFDVDSDRIRVNVARVPPDELLRVLVHEMWHAMPRARIWPESDGRTLRASGFWLQEQRAGRRLWLPVEDRRGLPYASYLLDEAMATLMESRYAGPSRFSRPELDEVQQFLGRLMSVAGPTDVARQYLESRPYDLAGLAEAHRGSFPELEIAARP